MRRLRRELYVGAILLLLAFASRVDGQATSSPLPGTKLLTIDRPLDELMVDGISLFALQRIEASRLQRHSQWSRDFANPGVYGNRVKQYRQRLRTIVGAVDCREPADGFDLVTKIGRDGVVARTSDFVVYSIRWTILDGVTAEGLLVEPRNKPVARVVALPDADWTPEMFSGIVASSRECGAIVRRLAENRIQVVVPTLVSRDDTFSGNSAIGLTNQPHREFIYRQAFQLGRHIIGYEVEKVQAAIDQFEIVNQRDNIALPIGVVGVGEGGLLALYAAAIDPRISASMVSGYFQTRERIWEEPVYRNVWALLTEFGDAEIAGLIAPRPLVIEACAVPEFSGPRPAKNGRLDSAAPGRIRSCAVDQVRAEFDQAKTYYNRLNVAERISLVLSNDGNGTCGSDGAIETFFNALGISTRRPASSGALELTSNQIDPSYRQRKQVQELTEYTQRLMRQSAKVRDRLWSKANRSNIEDWPEAAEFYRSLVWEELIGKLPPPTVPPNVRTRQIIDDDAYRGYEVAIDVYPNVLAAGILLLPKTLEPNEKRPVVVCQHGLEGVPRDTISTDGEAYRYYKSFAAELCKRGFVVYAPQNPYRGGDRFRVIQRQSNPLKLSLFSYIIRQHERTLEWLKTLPNVDADRIGFYGLSYGGKTAMRVPPILERTYAVCICSGDFNDWIRKTASVDESYSYICTGEYEMPEWNMAHIANYAELATLMFPRPFMVERGHDDGVAPDEWVSAEYAKVKRLYDRFDFGERTEIEFFNGPHTIHGVHTYEFLDKHLNPRKPKLQ